MECDKKRFSGKRSARQSVKSMHHSIRVYRCENCGYYHVTKERNRFGVGKKKPRHAKIVQN